MTAATASRLDVALVDRSLAPSRERAQSLIAAGLVEVDGRRARSAAERVGEASVVKVTGRDHPWAGRGGLKLDAALEAFNVSCGGRVCLDAGASTGGFTDVLLARGAVLVHAVDVGRGLLDSRLAADPRVHVMDGTNLRTVARIPGRVPELVTLDLAFISVRAVLPNLCRIAPRAEVVALFKPQFELGRGAVGRGGIVRDQRLVGGGIEALQAWMVGTLGASILSAPVPAAVRGTKGNQEWFVHLRLPAEETP
jgi:23S rRNA (cytidine1920-2'-O)/16S rRNA (cytidine1409-2'-O)-methyltransferase